MQLNPGETKGVEVRGSLLAADVEAVASAGFMDVVSEIHLLDNTLTDINENTIPDLAEGVKNNTEALVQLQTEFDAYKAAHETKYEALETKYEALNVTATAAPPNRQGRRW
jgi:hypothetical protein